MNPRDNPMLWSKEKTKRIRKQQWQRMNRRQRIRYITGGVFIIGPIILVAEALVLVDRALIKVGLRKPPEPPPAYLAAQLVNARPKNK